MHLPLGDQNFPQSIVDDAFKMFLVTLIAGKPSPTPNLLLSASRAANHKSGQERLDWKCQTYALGARFRVWALVVSVCILAVLPVAIATAQVVGKASDPFCPIL